MRWTNPLSLVGLLALALVALVAEPAQGAVGGVVGSTATPGLSTRVRYANEGANLSNIVAQLQSGDTLFIGPGFYRLNSPAWNQASLRIVGKTNIQIIGAGKYATHLTNANLGPCLDLYYCSNIVVQGMTIRGVRTNAVYDPAPGIVAHNSVISARGTNYNSIFRDLVIANINGQGICIADSDGHGGAAGVNILQENIDFIDIGSELGAVGLVPDGTAAFFYDHNSKIVNCNFRGNLRDIESWSEFPQSGSLVQGCTFREWRNESILIQTQDITPPHETIWDLRFIGNTWIGSNTVNFNEAFQIESGGKISIVGNHFINCAYGVTAKDDSDRTLNGLFIANNTFSGGWYDAIQVARNTGARNATMSNVVIQANQFFDIGRDAIRVSANNATIANNRINRTGTNGGAGWGIRVGMAGFFGTTNAYILHNSGWQTPSGFIELGALSTNSVANRNWRHDLGTVVNNSGAGNTVTAFP